VTSVAAEGKRSGRMLERVRERKERHKERGKLYRVGFAIVGGLVIVGGLLLSLPGVPGPGLLLVAVGLGMLALEFDRAERLLERIVDRVERVSEGARSATPLQKALVVLGLVVVAAAAVAALVVWDVPLLPG
jgi:uncharacterized protein (TIGR02611 family)